jgi:hypothetical protein
MKKPWPSTIAICVLLTSLGNAAGSNAVAETENLYADMLDAYGALSTVDSGLPRNSPRAEPVRYAALGSIGTSS